MIATALIRADRGNQAMTQHPSHRAPGFDDALAAAKAMSFQQGTAWLVVRREVGGYYAIPEYEEVVATVIDGKIIPEVKRPPHRLKPWHYRPKLHQDDLLFLACVFLVAFGLYLYCP